MPEQEEPGEEQPVTTPEQEHPVTTPEQQQPVTTPEQQQSASLPEEDGGPVPAPEPEPEPEPREPESTAAAPLSKELTFPELSLRSGSQEQEEEEEPAEPRDTAAFPKAFERELVTPDTALGDGDGGHQPAGHDRRSVQFTQRPDTHSDELDETKKQKVGYHRAGEELSLSYHRHLFAYVPLLECSTVIF